MQPTENGSGVSKDVREERIFRSLDLNNDGQVLRKDLVASLAETGLSEDDLRIRESMMALTTGVGAEDVSADSEAGWTRVTFRRAIRHNILLLERALQGNLVIPDFTPLTAKIRRIYEAARENRSGTPASYIPQLDLAEPDVDRFGVALCTIDGQRATFGDSDCMFSVQSCCKPLNYCLALEQQGVDKVHAHIGREPSGSSFNELILDRHNRPHNPMINAGAILSCALIALPTNGRPASDIERRGVPGERFEGVLERWTALCGGRRPGFNNAVYLSERQTADRNFALAYYMREKGVFPSGADLEDVLDFYFQCCAIEVDADMMSVAAATLANGGICPLTGERVFDSQTVQHCLSLMSSCGMYDFSGEFAFRVGLPAKSGVSGAVVIVIPDVMGVCTWSPRLDENGNSVRGIEFCQRLVEAYNFHSLANISGAARDADPRTSAIALKARQVNELIWAASKGDIGAIQQHLPKEGDVNGADYDLRTPLHLAAAEGRLNVVEFYIEQHRVAGVDLNPRDRWGGTPLDDAERHRHEHVVAVLQEAGCTRGRRARPRRGERRQPSTNSPVSDDMTDELIWAASLDDIAHIRRLVARGARLDCADYDLRTPLHLAAAEGHVDVVRYLLDQGVPWRPLDRWGGTPLDDAIRHQRPEVVGLLRTRDHDTSPEPIEPVRLPLPGKTPDPILN